jgi:hypothetical protein
MSEQSKQNDDPDVDGQDVIARRVVLQRGAKLVYVVPAVLAAMTAKSAFAGSQPP